MTNHSTRSPAEMTPEDVVRAYLAVDRWQDRLPFVLDPKRVAPLMALKYQNFKKPEEGLKPGTIRTTSPSGSPADRFLVTIDISESHPEKATFSYIVVKTKEGSKVDWEASQAQAEKDRDDLERRALRLENPLLEIRVLKIRQRNGSPWVEVVFQITNRSNRRIESWGLKAEALDRRGAFLAKSNALGRHLDPGESQTEDFNFETASPTLASWKPIVRSVQLDLGGGRTADATKHFAVKVVEP